MAEPSPLAFQKHARMALQGLMTFGANLAIASALGGLAASALWSENALFSTEWVGVARGIAAALLILAGGLWAYLASLLFITHLNLNARIKGRRAYVRGLEVLILAVALPVTIVPFAMVANARVVAECDQWWSGHVDTVLVPRRCMVLSQERGVIRRVPDTSRPSIEIVPPRD